MTENIKRHPGQLPIYEALKQINAGEMQDVPVPDGLTEAEVVRGIQLDQLVGRRAIALDSEYSVPRQLGRCCARFCLKEGYESELSQEELLNTQSVCPGLVFAGIEFKPSDGRASIVTECPGMIPDERLPLGQRRVSGYTFTPQQISDEKVDSCIEGLTPRNPEDVASMVKIVLKDYKPRDPVETYSHSECFVYKTRWALGIGLELQEMVFGANDKAKKNMGDDYSVNKAIEYISEQILNRITKPRTKYTARHLAVSFAHLVASYAKTAQQPREM